jgi:xanthine dehydrogenase accessory factor
MDPLPQFNILSSLSRRFAIVLGTNEIASAVAVGLTREGFIVVLSHDPFPPVIRRGMAFHDALFDDEVEIDGIRGLRGDSALALLSILSKTRCVAVTPLQVSDLITLSTPEAIVDARMQKHRVTPDLRRVTRLAVGLGPNFTVNHNCDVAIETHPVRTGELVERGATLAADGVARELGGVGAERFLLAPRDGVWRTSLDIGARIFRGFTVGHHDGVPLQARMDGFLRGVARDETFALGGAKLVEIDPRGRAAAWKGMDERGRAIALATVRSVLSAPTRRRDVVSLSELAQ